jgi:MFS family permease
LVLPWIGMICVFTALLQIFMPLQVQALAPDDKVATLGWVMGIGALCAALTNPVAGWLSDRSGSRWGRRTPWLLGAAVVSLGALLLLGQASSLWMLAACFCLVQVATNVYQANLVAVMPDRIPSARRGVASGVIGVGLPLGGVVGSVIASRHADQLPLGYALVGAVMVVMTLLFIFSDREPPATRPEPPVTTVRGPTRWLDNLSAFSHRDFTWTFAARFLCLLGETLLSGFLLYMLQDFVQLDPGSTPASVVAKLAPMGLLAMLIAAVVAGYFSDRIGRRKPFVALAAALLALNCGVLYTWRTETGVLVFYIINGLALGAFMAAIQSLSADVLPNPENTARDLGVMSVANAGPQVLAPLMGAAVVGNLGGYVSLLALSAVVLVAAMLCLLGIRGVR